MANYFILNHGSGSNKKSTKKLINHIYHELGENNNNVICNDGAGSGGNTGPLWSGHEYIQRAAKDVVKTMRDRNWSEDGTFIFISFSRGCMLAWQILYEFYHGGEGSGSAPGVKRQNVHLLQLDPSYGEIRQGADYYQEMKLGQRSVTPLSNITEVYMLNSATAHWVIRMLDTPSHESGIKRKFMPGYHEELAEFGHTFWKGLALIDGWLHPTQLQPYARKFLPKFLEESGVPTSYNLNPGFKHEWLSMYAQFKLSKKSLRGNWGSTKRQNLTELYEDYRRVNNLGNSGFFINTDDRNLFQTHARALFPDEHHDELFKVLSWRRGRGDRNVAWLKLAFEKYDKLRKPGVNLKPGVLAVPKLVSLAVYSSVIEHLKHRVNRRDWL